MIIEGTPHATPRPTHALARRAEPFSGWRTIQVPENEDDYLDPGRFGTTPSKGLFSRHLKNIEVFHVEIASTTPDPRPLSGSKPLFSFPVVRGGLADQLVASNGANLLGVRGCRARQAPEQR
jgi:hypothetical protein